jgi:hypothetical protein
MNPDDRIALPRIDPSLMPFTGTAAYRRYGSTPDPDVDAAEDLYLRAIIEEQGFDGLPHVVPRRMLDAYVAAGEIELLHGVARPEHADQFRGGRFFVGRGVYRGGANAVASPDALAVARTYADGGVILRISLKAGVRIADYDEMTERAFAGREQQMRRSQMDEQQAITAIEDGDGTATASVQARYRAAREALHAQYDDIGRLAAYLGYDVVYVADRDYYCILNRTAVRVQMEDIR